MATNILQKKTDPLTYKRIPFDNIKFEATKKKVFPTQPPKQKKQKKPKSWIKNLGAPATNASKQPKGTTFGV